jgi:hypothetical protein
MIQLSQPCAPLRAVAVIAALAGPAVASVAPAAAGPSFAPVFTRELDTIELVDPLGPVERPWYGGFEKARPQLADIDADGDLDLFVAEDDGRLRFYRNDGTPAAADFRFVTDDWTGHHELFFTRLVDLDVDGDFDLLVEAPEFVTIGQGGVEIYRPGAYLWENTGTPQDPVWELFSPRPDGYFADENGDPIPFATTAPDFVDLEGDGDPDLLMGDPSGTIILYRNVGTPSEPSFRFETDSYQDVIIVFGSCGDEVAGPRTLGELLGTDDPGRHGFMLFSFFDVDADGFPDLFVGDEFNSNIYFYENAGGAGDPVFYCVSEAYFPGPGGPPGSFTRRLLAAFGDLDADGDAECVFGGGVSSEESIGLWLFRNEGSPTVPQFVLEDENWLGEFDRGRHAAPLLTDLENDGLIDLYVGAQSYDEISWYGNIGTAAEPAFAAFAEHWMLLPNAGWIVPETADLDADGDLDLFVGTVSGAVRYWRNEGDAGAPDFVEVTDDPAFGEGARLIRQTLRLQAVPRFLDADADGDLDLVGGRFVNGDPDATLLWFRNDGTPQAHDLVFAGEWGNTGPLGQSAYPELGDLDGDGDPDLVVGGVAGDVRWWENVGTPAWPAYEARGPLATLDVGTESIPALADVDGDGDPDLFVGETGGGLNFLRNETPAGANPTPFALEEPAAGASVDGRAPVRFEWEASTDPDGGAVEYTLRLAASPGAPPSEWWTIPGLAGSQADVVIHQGEFRFRPDLWWTVVASDGARNAPVPEWRPLGHATWDRVHGEPPDAGGQERDFVPPAPRAVELSFSAPYPSPTRGEATLAFALPEAGPVRLVAYDLLGRRVATIADRELARGPHTLAWDGEADDGTVVGPGVFLLRLEWGGRSLTRRLVRIP